MGEKLILTPWRRVVDTAYHGGTSLGALVSSAVATKSSVILQNSQYHFHKNRYERKRICTPRA